MAWTRKGTGTYAGSASPITAYDGGVLASASTVTLQDAFHSVSGTTQVNSFSYAGGTDRGVFLIRPTGAFPIGTSGNIVGAPALAVVDRVMMFWYDGTNYYYISSVVGAGSVITSSIADDAVTYAKMQEMAAYSVLGNATGSTANPTAIAASANEYELLRVADGLSWQRKPYVTVPDLDLTNATDNRAKIQAVIDRLTATGFGGTILLPECGTSGGRIRVEGSLLVQGNGITIEGMGSGTQINFIPAGAGDDFITFQAPTVTAIARCGLRNMMIRSSDTSTQKIAIKLVGTSEFHAERVYVFGWTGSNSIALQWKGHDFTSFHKCLLQADRPVSIEENPIHTTDLDHCSMRDMYILASASNPCVEIADGITLTEFRLENIALVGGSHGIKWVDTTTVQNSSGFFVSNTRREQGTSAAGYAIQIEHNQRLRNLYLSNVQAGGTGHGYKLRKCVATMVACQYYAPATVALDIDGSNEWVRLYDCYFFGGATVNSTGMSVVYEEMDGTDATEPLHRSVLFIPSANGNIGNAVRYRDASFNLVDDGDATKVIKFDASLISTATARTITAPDANTRLPIASQFLTISGPTAARTVTLPDADFTAARTDAGNQFTGNQGIGVAPSGTAGELLLIRTDADAATMATVYNADSTNTGALAQLRAVANNGSLSIVAHGPARVIARWGQTLGGWVEMLAATAPGKGLAIGTNSTLPVIIGTNTQSRTYLSGTAKTLTESAATAIADVSVGNNTIIAGTVHYTVEANDGATYQARRGHVDFLASNAAGTVTATLGTVTETAHEPSGTLAVTPTLSTGAAKITINLNAVSSLAQTTLVGSWRVEVDGGSGSVVAV